MHLPGPMHDEAAPRSSEFRGPWRSGHPVSASVLVADDERALREGLARILRADGHTVTTAADGAEALAVFRELRPDVVLLDVMMPKLDGFEVCRRLKADPDSLLTPVVLVTGLGDVQDRVRGIEAGADDFIVKPFERLEVTARVQSLARIKRYTDELERAELVLFALARSIEGKDPYTEGHCERLSLHGSALGRRLGLPAPEVEALRRAGIVHDIGKVAVPDAILLKPGPLTPEERAIMRAHPVTGEHICLPIRSFTLVHPIIRHHHEKRDGSGYPDGLAGEAIPLTARILQVVDVYDALTTERPYKRTYAPAEALEILGEEVARGWWDPDVYAEFRRYILDGVGVPAGSAG